VIWTVGTQMAQRVHLAVLPDDQAMANGKLRHAWRIERNNAPRLPDSAAIRPAHRGQLLQAEVPLHY
jgi:hypothetical protein